MSRSNVTNSERASNPERPLSPALQRQVAVLRLHQEADYIFFDDQDRPVPFIMPEETDRSTRMVFQLLLEGCMFDGEMATFHVVAEYLIAAMARKPGLSVAGILAQLSKEYEVDVTKMMMAVQDKKMAIGFDSGKTFLEDMSKDLVKTFVSGRR
jgi:hypothetical protein